jgi:branched-chain amino acid aminotransferase
VRFTALPRDVLYCADEIFLTGTAAEVTPVREIDGRTVGTGKPGEITRRVQQQFTQIVQGESAPHREFLSRV